MLIKKLVTIFLTLFILSSCDDSSSSKSANLPVVFESTINLIVDGKYIELKKRYGCEAKTFTKAGGDKFSQIKQVGHTVSHKLSTGEYIIASVPWACNRFGIDKRDENGKAVSYKITRPLPDNFLPYIAIADKGPVPDKAIVYASERAYKAKASRIEFRGINLKVASKGGKPSKKDKFNWFLSAGGGNGPHYQMFAFTRSIMFPELREILDKYLSGATEPVRLHNKRWIPKYDEIRKFYQGLRVGYEYGQMNNKMYYQMFPDIRRSSPKSGGNVNPSRFEHRASGFLLKENTDFSSDTLELRYDKNYDGIYVIYRMPYEHFQHTTPTLARTKNLKYILPGGGIYYHHAGDNISHILYNPSENNLYKLGVGDHSTLPLKGWGMDKYNYKTRRKK